MLLREKANSPNTGTVRCAVSCAVRGGTEKGREGVRLDGGAVNELLVGLREEDMTKGLETNRSKKTGCLSLVSLLQIIIQ